MNFIKGFLLYFFTICFGVVTAIMLAIFFSGPLLPIKNEKLVLGIEDIQEVNNVNPLLIEPNLAIDFKQQIYPLIVPTNGIAAHQNFLYLPPAHGGIDIWTNIQGTGTENSDSKGNPVYAACSGTIVRVYHPNEEIELKCDKLDDSYTGVVPSLKIKVLYAHMGDAVTHETYHNLRVGQRVNQGEFVGYQGNVSSIVPINRVTHLHFGIYDLSKGGVPQTLDPALYIGIPTTKVGQIYISGQNQ